MDMFVKVIGILILSLVWGWVLFGAKFSEDKVFVKVVATLVYIAALYQMLGDWLGV